MTQWSEQTLFGHPKGLFVLFLTEMWERFSYYGMRALLVYYMIKQLMFTQGEASQIYGLYTGLVYLTPLFGGILADRVLGQRRTVILGAVLMAIGHFLMAFQSVFFPALLFLILGNGAFKPNISTQVGSLYPAGDPRRDRAFSIFYVGINLGAFFSPLVCGTLGEVYGWHYGFSAAGIGMVIGLLIYLSGQRWLAPDNLMERETCRGKGAAAYYHGRKEPNVGPDCRLSYQRGILGRLRATRQYACALGRHKHRPPYFRVGIPGIVVSIPQPSACVPLDARYHHVMGVAIEKTERAVSSHEDGSWLFPAGIRLPCHDSGRDVLRIGWNTCQCALALFLYSVGHPWRVIFVSGRSVFGNQALPGSYSVHDDGDLVLVVVFRELWCWFSRSLLGEDAEGCLLPHDSGYGLLRGSSDPADSQAPEASHGAERQHVRANSSVVIQLRLGVLRIACGDCWPLSLRKSPLTPL